MLTAYLLGGIPLLSLVSFVVYWWDKRQAIHHARRTPEARLLVIDLLGGWPGGWIAQNRFRHKTSKLSYRVRFYAAVALPRATGVSNHSSSDVAARPQ